MGEKTKFFILNYINLFPSRFQICDMPYTPVRGMMIVLEGLDRSGKTTQAQKLLGYFQSVSFLGFVVALEVNPMKKRKSGEGSSLQPLYDEARVAEI